MRKFLSIFLLAITVLLSGCGEEATPAITPMPEAEPAITTTQPSAATDGQVSFTPAVETPQPEQDSFSGNDPLDLYIADVENQAGQIRSALDEAVTQREMTAKAGELYTLWDDALNYLWAELEKLMPEDEFSLLLEEQLAWIAQKEEAVAESGKQFEGGSAYSMAVSLQAAQITEERVYVLYELLQANTK